MCIRDRASPISVECVTVEGKSPWLWPIRAHTVFEFPARGNMPPVTIHAYQNMRGKFQNPPGMAEGERLFPTMDNLAREKGRPFPETGDGTLLIGSQLTADGQPVPEPGQMAPALAGGPLTPPTAPPPPPRGPMPGGDPALRAPGNLSLIHI